ncbi:MAG: double zinc ribbon domain-containing protein [Verrucomicrobiales bacterium]
MPGSSWPKRCLEAFVGLLYPRVCPVCDEALEGAGAFCRDCRSRMEPVGSPTCERCGEIFEGDLEGSSLPQCPNCRGRELHFEFALAGFRARGAVRELVHRFKYRGELHLRGALGELMEEAFLRDRLVAATASGDWILVPVPMHRRRRRQREFNQAQELVRELSRRRALPWAPALRRLRDTPRQARLDRAQRLRNLEGAFAMTRRRGVRDRVRGAGVLLVDDVLTTGATANLCARVLREEGGAREVVVVTLARG